MTHYNAEGKYKDVLYLTYNLLEEFIASTGFFIVCGHIPPLAAYLVIIIHEKSARNVIKTNLRIAKQMRFL